MQYKKIYQLLASAALVTALPLSALAQGKEPVKVGLVSSKSGVFAEQGEEVMRAVKFAIEEANSKGGIDGRKVEVQEGDDESTPDAGRRVAEKMARDGHNLLIGAVPSSISLAIAQNLDRWDAAYFIQASKSDKLTGDTCKPRSFRTNHSDAMDIAMINEWAKKIKGNTFAVIAADYVWGRDSGESFKKAMEAQGKKVPLTLYVPMGTKDFSPYIAQLKAANVDGIWVAEVGRDAMAFVKQAGEFNLIPNTPLIGHALISNFIINATGKNLEGVPGNSGYAADLNNPRNKEFVAAWKAKFNRMPTDAEGQAYNGAQVMFDGVRLAKSVKPEDVSKALRGAELNTIYGKVTMRAADNQLMLPNYVGRVKMVDGALRPVIEDTYPASLTPPPSPLCKM
ncbi:branched-chain amino acid ABC transporter substrate-binding protein [Limnohabitans sp. Rim8]|jgi:branched-chain amino acid transport system substrate-binding protein|uniref:Branched-chain amino acid ABC transporter substrate-binding protein n=1 Tax=Limnohabitans curvus TaxID=323423 RepID=A0A315ENQ3_9BURK|nr:MULTISPECIES: ABC transporter substrate-binding protein [Limnohabitans]PUE56145.1 branched-chain amino acid ABC transporter substrate-binding protein [Limnohabitans sp. Rim8]PUE58375.1 branched-chain amino acid ABC transporter substrate-binding protein [Limnohabitans curvus]